MADCNEEGLHKCYTAGTIEFDNGSKRNWVFQCNDHFFGKMNEPWFAPAGFNRGEETIKIRNEYERITR